MMSPMSDLLFPSEWGSPEGRKPDPTHSEKGDHEHKVESQDTVTGTDAATDAATDAGTAADTEHCRWHWHWHRHWHSYWH
jgi:hypothetical protein